MPQTLPHDINGPLNLKNKPISSFNVVKASVPFEGYLHTLLKSKL